MKSSHTQHFLHTSHSNLLLYITYPFASCHTPCPSYRVFRPNKLIYLGLNIDSVMQDRLRPYCDESQKRNILNGRMNPLPVNVSSSTRDLVRKLLRSSPDDRVILEDISRHPAMAMPGPIDSVFEEEVCYSSGYFTPFPSLAILVVFT